MRSAEYWAAYGAVLTFVMYDCVTDEARLRARARVAARFAKGNPGPVKDEEKNETAPPPRVSRVPAADLKIPSLDVPPPPREFKLTDTACEVSIYETDDGKFTQVAGIRAVKVLAQVGFVNAKCHIHYQRRAGEFKLLPIRNGQLDMSELVPSVK